MATSTTLANGDILWTFPASVTAYTFTPPAVPLSIRYLVVGGGASSIIIASSAEDNKGGSGGGGEVKTGTTNITSGGTITVVSGLSEQNSSITTSSETITARKGNRGSGGTGGSSGNLNAGGNSYGSGGSLYPGGGGGAGGVGGNSSGGSCGSSGAGISNDITGSAISYGLGGSHGSPGYGLPSSQNGVVYLRYTDLDRANIDPARTAIITFYRDTFVPYRRYLMDSDMMASVTPAIGTTVTNLVTAANVAAATYLNFPASGAPTDRTGFTALASGTTYAGIRDTYNAAIRQFVSALLTRLNTQYKTWTVTYGMAAPITPANFDDYAKDGGTWSTDNATVTNVATPITAAAGTTSVASIRDALCNTGTYWPNLVSAMQTFTTSRLTQLNHLYTWATTPTTGAGSAVGENTLGTHAATVGLNASVQPLVYTQPVVTASGTTRTFYGIILNTGTATATNVTLLGFEWRVVADPPAAWTNTAATLVAAAAFSKAHTFSPVPAAGTQIQVRAYVSDTPSVTYTAAGTNMAYGNIITFTY